MCNSNTSSRLTFLPFFTVLLLAGCGGDSDSDSDTNDGNQISKYTVSTSVSEGGSITPSSLQVSEGNSASFTITADDGYEIDSASGCNGMLEGSTYTTGAIHAHCSVNVSFSPLQFTITTDAGNGGTISPNEQTVSFGESASFEILADEDYQLESASGCNGELTDNLYVITNVKSDCTFQANFQLIPLAFNQVYEDIHEFFDDTIIPEHEYGGTIFPEGLISYQTQGRTVDLWWDSQPDVIFSPARGYSAGIDTRVKPYLFQNINGRMVYAEDVEFPATNGARRWATLGGEKHDSSKGIFYIGHKAGEIHGQALLLESGSVPRDITDELPTFPLVNVTGNPYDVNAHSMAGGDINGDGRTDFVVGDWGACDQTTSPWTCYDTPFYLIQSTIDTAWRLETSPFLRELALEQPLVNENAGEGFNLMLDLHLFDANNDGLDDLVVGYGHGSSYSYLYFNQGPDVNGVPRYSKEHRVQLPEPPFGIDNSLHLRTWNADFNDDGAEDLLIIWSRFVPYYGGSALQLLYNDGTGKFSDVTQSSMSFLTREHLDGEVTQWGDDFSIQDTNNDGFPDLVGSDQRRVRLWLNDGSGVLTEIPVETERTRAMPANSGWADLSGEGRIGSVFFDQSCTNHLCEELRLWFYQVEFNRPIRSYAEETALLND